MENDGTHNSDFSEISNENYFYFLSFNIIIDLLLSRGNHAQLQVRKEHMRSLQAVQQCSFVQVEQLGFSCTFFLLETRLYAYFKNSYIFSILRKRRQSKCDDVRSLGRGGK